MMINAAIEVLKEHRMFLVEEIKSERRRLAEAEKVRDHHLGAISIAERALSEIDAALVEIEK